MSILQEKKELLVSSKQFLEYLESQKFNPEFYEKILELNQGVDTSISSFLEGDNQFLLSTKVDYQDIIDSGICGAYGYVREDGIYVPKTLEGDRYFFGGHLPKVLYPRYSYEYPALREDRCDYDVVVSKGLSKEDKFDLIINSNLSLFLGDVLDLNDEDYKEVRKELVCRLYKIRSDNYNMSITAERDSSSNKEYILLSRTKRY